MSDDEEVMVSDEEGSESEADEGPSEAERAMQKSRPQLNIKTDGLDEQTLEILEAARQEREKEAEEIRLLREKRIQRKKEREQEEREMNERRQEEEDRRRREEEDRKKKKNEEEDNKKEARAKKMAEFEKWKNPSTPNFVISKKDRPAGPAGAGPEEEGADHEHEKKSREQLEAEKQAILKQRISSLDIDGLDSGKLSEKARELHAQLFRLESEKYDLERRFKNQLGDMMELAERARNMNKVGKQGTLKRIQLGDDETDVIQEKFAGCPAKIVMYSEYERQKDKRDYGIRREIYKGPVYGFPAERIPPARIVRWNEDGLPLYEEMEGAQATEAAQE